MVTANDIRTEINRLLVNKFTQWPVYINLCPKDFKRPSFLIEFVKENRKDASRTAVEITTNFTITCFVAVDDYHRSDAEELIDAQSAVMHLFCDGYIKVGDRAVKVSVTTNGTNLDEAKIDLQFNYFDDRSDESEDIPVIGEVITKITKEE